METRTRHGQSFLPQSTGSYRFEYSKSGDSSEKDDKIAVNRRVELSVEGHQLFEDI